MIFLQAQPRGPRDPAPPPPGLDWLKDTWTFRSDEMISPSSIVAVIVIVAIVMGTLWYIKYLRHRATTNAPVEAFRTIAARLGLTQRDEKLLTHIARQQALPSPITLLCSMATLEYHARRYAKSQNPGVRPRIAKHVDHLKHRLFDEKLSSSASTSDTR